MAEPYTQKTATQKTFDEFIKQYSVLIKQQQITFDDAVQDIVTTMEANAETVDIGYTQEDIETILKGQQQTESIFARAMAMFTTKSKENQDTQKEISSFTQEISENIKENNDFVSKQSEGNKELVEYARLEAEYVADSNKAVNVMASGFKLLSAPGEGFGEVKDYGKGEYQTVTSDNKAIEIGEVLFKSFRGWKNDITGMGGGETDEYDMSDVVDEGVTSNQMLDDISSTLSDSAVDTSDQTQMLNDISSTMTDSYELEQEQYLRELREQSKDKPGGKSWLQKLLIGMGIGMALGAWLRSIVLPFEVVFKGITWSLAKFGKNIKSMATIISAWAKQSKGISAMAKVLRNFRSWVVAMAKFSHLGVLNRLFGSFIAVYNIFKTYIGKLSGLGKQIKQLEEFVFAPIIKTFRNLSKVIDKGTMKLISRLRGMGGGFKEVSRFLFLIRQEFKTFSKALKTSTHPMFSFFKETFLLFRRLDDVIQKVGLELSTKLSKSKSIFAPLGKMFSIMFKYFKFLGAFFNATIAGFKVGLRIGFKFLGWPLTMLLGIIDFIKGFRATEGDMVEKIMGGLKAAFIGFVEAPVRIIGWVIDKVMGWFGVEMEGTGDKIMGWFEWMFDNVLSNLAGVLMAVKLGAKAFFAPITLIIATFKGIMAALNAFADGEDVITIISVAMKTFLGSVIELPVMVIGWVIDNVMKIFGMAPIDGGATSMIMGFVNGVIDWLMKGVKIIFDGVTKMFKGLFDFFSSFIDFFGSLFTGDFSGVKDAVIGMVNGVINAWTGLFDILFALPRKLLGLIRDAAMKYIPGAKMASEGMNKVKEVGKSVLNFIGVGSDEKEIPQMAFGGLTKTSGLAFLHPAEIVGPAKEVIPQILNEASGTGIGESVSNLFNSEAKVKKNGSMWGRKIESILNSTNTTLINNIKEEKRIKQGEKGGQNAKAIMMGSRQVIEPPADIETLGLLFFNKTWGIA